MPEIVYVIVVFASVLIRVISFAMLARAILSWIDIADDSKLVRLVYVLTEPALIPLRKLFYKMNWFQEMPFDMSFTFTWLILIILEMLLGAIPL